MSRRKRAALATKAKRRSSLGERIEVPFRFELPPKELRRNLLRSVLTSARQRRIA